MVRKKTKYIIGVGLILSILIFIAALNNRNGSASLLEEHCLMLPGLDGCEQYIGKYQEKSQIFDRSIDNLPLVENSQIYEILDDNMLQFDINPVKKVINSKEIRMYGYNNQIPGPLIRVNQNSTIYVNVTNNLDMETTVHWHGIRLKNKFDGVPNQTQDPIQPDSSFLYELTFPDAGIYWYHPHVREDYQQELGLYGNIFVVSDIPDYYNPVNREEFVFLDDIQFTGEDITPTYKDKVKQVLMGRFGNMMFINGKEDYNITVKRGETVRFYLTNTANTRLFNFSIENTKLKLIGSDGGNYERESFVNSIILSPSERGVVEAIFEKPGLYPILHINPENQYVLGFVKILSEDTEADYSSEFYDLRNNQYVIKDLEKYRQYLSKEPDVDLKLDIEFPGGKALGQDIKMSHADESGFEWEDGVMHNVNLASSSNTISWIIKDTKTGKSNMDIMYNWKVGDKVKMRITNDGDSAHPMQHPIHLHGQRFLVLATDGVPNNNLVWKDTVLVPTGKSADILVDMTNPGKWMTHCHIAEHLSDGMMFEFEVEE